MMRHILFMLPIVIFTALAAFFGYRLVMIDRGDTPDIIPSAMIGKPVPEFNLPGLKTADLKGKVIIVNFFASWCMPCRAEHENLIGLKDQGFTIIGIDYKDAPGNLKKWLDEKGNPYHAIGLDLTGATAIDFGVYGMPETFIVDSDGIIRFKQTGPLSKKIIETKLIPAVKELEK